MLVVYALVCALGQDPKDCVSQTAREKINIMHAATPFQCFKSMGELNERGVYAGEGEYLKIVCERQVDTAFSNP